MQLPLVAMVLREASALMRISSIIVYAIASFDFSRVYFRGRGEHSPPPPLGELFPPRLLKS